MKLSQDMDMLMFTITAMLMNNTMDMLMVAMAIVMVITMDTVMDNRKSLQQKKESNTEPNYTPTGMMMRRKQTASLPSGSMP